MPAIVRLSKKELIDLIESTEAAGCDTACLRGLLAEVEEEEQHRQPARRRVPLEEITTEEHIEAIRQQSYIEHGDGLKCMVCHDKFDQLVSGTCEACFRKWALSTKKR